RASRLALDDGGGRCSRPDAAHTFAVSGYVIPGVPGSPGAIPVPPAAVGDARVALRAELVRRGVGVADPVRRQRGGDRLALRDSARLQDAEKILRGLVALDVARDPVLADVLKQHDQRREPLPIHLSHPPPPVPVLNDPRTRRAPPLIERLRLDADTE